MKDLLPGAKEVFRNLPLQGKVGGHSDRFDFGVSCQFGVIGIETRDFPSLLHFIDRAQVAPPLIR